MTHSPKVPPLPLELWQLIGSYVDDDTAKRLIKLNRGCFELALDARYRHIRLFRDGKWSKEKMIRWIKHLLEPSILKRITSLEINSRPAGAYTHDPTRPSTFTSKVLQKLILIEDDKTSDERSCLIRDLCTELVLAIRDLQSLVIIQENAQMERDGDLFNPIVSLVWSHQTKDLATMTLRDVSYRGHWQDVWRLLPVTSDTAHRAFHLLEGLTFSYQPARVRGNSESPEDFIDILEKLSSPAPLAPGSRVNSIGHLSQLRSLSLEIPEYSGALARYIFQVLSSHKRAFPHLTHLALTGNESFSPTHTSFSAEFRQIADFLVHHQSTITHLRIPIHALRPIPYTGPPHQPPHPSEHPAPRMLALEHLEVWGASDIPLLVVDNARSSLRRRPGGCVVYHESNKPSEIRDFVGFLDLTPFIREYPITYQGGVLRSLALEFVTLTPMHFELLSQYLPRLQQLRLSIYMAEFPFWRYGDNNGPHANLLPVMSRAEKNKEQDLFFSTLESESYEKWALEDLRIEVLDVGERTLKRARDVFRQVMPRLRILMIQNGIGSTKNSTMDSGGW